MKIARPFAYEIIEGVKEERQAEILGNIGCHETQGWQYAQAMLPDDLIVWLDKKGKHKL